MASTPHESDSVDIGDVVFETVVHSGEKSLLARGHLGSRPVVIKVLRTAEEFWRAKFAREIRLYRAFSADPPPVQVPDLVHTDGHSVLVVGHIPGEVLNIKRYPEHPVEEDALASALEAVTAFGRWSPASGVLAPVFHYADRVQRYHRMGFFDEDDRDALHALLEQVSLPGQAAHGDPLPSNLLRTEGGCVLLDFEFTGLFLPGFDLAMLHTLLANTPGAQDRIETLVREGGIRVPYLVNQAMVISRELRLHTDLPDGELRRRRLALLRDQWRALRQQLHTHA